MSWERLVASNWQTDATVWRERASLLPVFDPSELFGAAVARLEASVQAAGSRTGPSADRLPAPSPVPPRLYVGAEEVDLQAPGHRALLPQAGDRHFFGYHARLTREFGVADYCLIVPDWHAHAPSLLEPLLDSVAALTQRVGISSARMDTQLFVGDYRTTPFGAHADPTSSFHVPVVGTKRMRVWSGASARAEGLVAGQLEYRDQSASSRVLEAQVGEAMYWPSHAWHVAESDGGLNVTWGLGYWFGDRLRDAVLDQLGAQWKHSDCAPQRQVATADAVASTMQRLGSVADSAELHRAALRLALEHESALGFWRMPALADTPRPLPCRVFARAAGRTIAWAPWGDAKLLVAARGHSMCVEDTRQMREALTAVVDGAPIGVPPRGPVAALVEFLLRARAVAKTPRATQSLST